MDEKIPILLIGNMCDLEMNREVSFVEGQERAREWGVPFIETSAKTGAHCHEMLVQCIRQINEIMPGSNIIKNNEKCIVC